MADGHDLSTRELGRRRGTAISAALLAAGVTGTIGLAGYTAWAHAQESGRSTATGVAQNGTDDAPGSADGRVLDGAPAFDQGQAFDQGLNQAPGQAPGQGQSQGQSQSQGQQGGGFPQLGGSSGPGQAGSAGS